jgi:hypothetical protein
MGCQLNLQVIDEEVEQLALLRRLHWQDAQRYLFSRPFNADVISTYVTERAGDRTSELKNTSRAVPLWELPLPSTGGAPT